MIKKIFVALAISAAAFSVNAEEVKPVAPVTAKFQPKYKITDEEWAKLTKEQKVKTLEAKRAENIKKSEDKWKKMTGDEKIAQYDKRRAKAKQMREGHGKKKDVNCVPVAAPANAAAVKEQPKPLPAKK